MGDSDNWENLLIIYNYTSADFAEGCYPAYTQLVSNFPVKRMNVRYFVVFFLCFWLIVRNYFRNCSQLFHQTIWHMNDVIPTIVLSFFENAFKFNMQNNLSDLILSFVVASNEGTNRVPQHRMKAVLLIVVQLGSVYAMERIRRKNPLILGFHE